jgi:hypothetical protein
VNDVSGALGDISAAGGSRLQDYLIYTPALASKILQQYQDYSHKLGYDYLLPYMMLHEIEHYWTVDYGVQNSPTLVSSRNPLVPAMNNIEYYSHYAPGVQSPYAGTDPMGAFKYDYLNNSGQLKICLSDMFPFKPASFHPYALHAMGLDSVLDLTTKYYSVTPNTPTYNVNEGVTTVDGECIYVQEPDSVVTQASIQDIINFWGPVQACS